jgi:beta-phosphoglucomutase-like phosphatase (HAD superfamily)
LFDFDGVLTKTARVPTVAWKAMFDAYQRERRRQPASASSSKRQVPDGMQTLRRREVVPVPVEVEVAVPAR